MALTMSVFFIFKSVPRLSSPFHVYASQTVKFVIDNTTFKDLEILGDLNVMRCVSTPNGAQVWRKNSSKLVTLWAAQW